MAWVIVRLGMFYECRFQRKVWKGWSAVCFEDISRPGGNDLLAGWYKSYMSGWHRKENGHPEYKFKCSSCGKTWAVTFPETIRSSFSRALAQASECQSEAILRKYEGQMPNETTYLVTNKRIQLILKSHIQ
ncbi:predicted protein [Histoplasma capsulatum G186AR]|uniref:Uncharacterized protein n=1 Tax=Ajellomyces capsulatus (strain G186AR / H82 / ATCC MYA-2454 / RMSCC 2432) TaxID=447093 RepID=C0NSP5_AJECG|nr:uncharacterized protein HCBG_06175 [Histoplasma capsulatum G186AR]EEH05911.1 predicted protein [Histoplasma capsulatum G186AR]